MQGHIAVPVVTGGQPEPFLGGPAVFAADPMAIQGELEKAQALVAYGNLLASERNKEIKAAIEAEMMRENALRQQLAYSSTPVAHSNPNLAVM